jgi:hypothetical protein
MFIVIQYFLHSVHLTILFMPGTYKNTAQSYTAKPIFYLYIKRLTVNMKNKHLSLINGFTGNALVYAQWNISPAP